MVALNIALSLVVFCSMVGFLLWSIATQHHVAGYESVRPLRRPRATTPRRAPSLQASSMSRA